MVKECSTNSDFIFLFLRNSMQLTATHPQEGSGCDQLNKSRDYLWSGKGAIIAGSFSKTFWSRRGHRAWNSYCSLYYKILSIIPFSSMTNMWNFSDQEIAFLKERPRRINELLSDWFAKWLKLIDFKLSSSPWWQDYSSRWIFHQTIVASGMQKAITWTRGLANWTDVYQVVWEKLQAIK